MANLLVSKVCASFLRANGSRCVAASVVVTPHRHISGKTMRGGPLVRPPPFPYQTKKLNYLRCYLDNPMKRFNENTKMIVVEGNIASGKTTLAKQLAEELEMLYLPEVSMDMLYVNDYGYDMRSLNHKLPDRIKCCDTETFYKNPNHPMVPTFQAAMYQLRVEQYLDAMAHLMNTGQGVILERCAFSDFVFAEAMSKSGYFNKLAKEHYYKLRELTLVFLFRPHLVIYLDAPIPTIMDRIKKRNLPSEVNSKVLTPEYLKTIELSYKETYLPEISNHSELLMYDWSEVGEVEMVVDDIERIDFDTVERQDNKLKDWDMDRWDISEKRYECTYWKQLVLNLFDLPSSQAIPGITVAAEDYELYHEIKESLPGNKYASGYNSELGDSNLFFKSGDHEKYYTVVGRDKKQK